MGSFRSLFGGESVAERQARMERERAAAREQEFAEFEALYLRHFPDYELMTDIPARVIYPGIRRNDARSVTFLFSKDGRPCLAVLLIDPDEYGCGAQKATERACETARLPFLRFFYGWGNEPGYVVNRTRAHLG